MSASNTPPTQQDFDALRADVLDLRTTVNDMRRNEKLLETAVDLLLQISVPAAGAGKLAISELRALWVHNNSRSAAEIAKYDDLISRIDNAFANIKSESDKNASL